jgi:damage-control phosphatase, subfamily I
MISDYRCFFCFTRAFENLLEKENISKEAKNCFTRDMISLYQNNWDKFTSPEFARELHVILRSYTNDHDPYKKEKQENNNQALNILIESEKLIKQSDDPFGTSLRIAIAGNIIDFAANDNFNILVTIDKALNSEFAIDHSKQLKKAIENADSVLYLGDNAGEIVFDRLFIETIKHPNLTYVVRGGPVINDATMEDAEYTGMTQVATVISNEYDAPSTIINKSGKHFQKYFKNADLIISKGQGNLEGLIPLNDSRIFFLVMIKCDVMSEFMKVKKDSFIVYNASC